MKLLNKIMSKFGYFPRNKFGELLTELVRESAYRGGEVLETEYFGLFIKVSAKDPPKLN